MGAESGEQSFEALAIFVSYGDEAEAKAAAVFYVANDGVGFDAAFLNEKVQFSGHAFFHVGMRSLDEQAFDADVEDAGDIVAAIATPADPDIFRGWEAG